MQKPPGTKISAEWGKNKWSDWKEAGEACCLLHTQNSMAIIYASVYSYICVYKSVRTICIATNIEI